jgi:predicted acylesterase/phospholipase RssA
MKRIPRCVVLSGGGTRCISFVGGLLYLKNKGLLQAVRKWYCCSAGALIAVLFSIGMPEKDILQFVHEFDFTQSRDFNAEDIMSIGETMGLDKGFALRKMIVKMLENIRKDSSRWTLREFKEATGNDVHYFISNVTLSVPFFASAASHPDLFVLDAIYATMAIPFYFCPYKDLPTGHYWCDGMLGGNFPWLHVPAADKRDAIGLYFPSRTVVPKPEFFDYLNSIISFRNNYEQRKIVNEWSDNIISIPTSEFPSIALDLSKKDREHLYRVGIEEVKIWWATKGARIFIELSLLESLGIPALNAGPRIRSNSQPHLAELPSDSRKSLPSLYTGSLLSRGLLPDSQQRVRRWSV